MSHHVPDCTSFLRTSCLAAMTCLLILAGCGKSDRPEIGLVEGTVTLDGQPLPMAKVQFAPQGGGRASTAVADANGFYILEYSIGTKGAKIGSHSVEVSTSWYPGEDAAFPQGSPEKVPLRYRKPDAIVEEVKEGKNTIDIQLTSK
ncbi:carboxypeptidase-like regulatory domain-containing protein [Planctomicrobium sp. SH664]|uniref:carboxypeptidase-like regulatory domain-containing protein n=1 Tax=Planctomicrobium sp. SH664 TaxID=3448125 RepID=UPI003F5BEB8B